MINNSNKTVLILGANSDVAKLCILQYLEKGFSIIASSRNLDSLESFVKENNIDYSRITHNYFDASDFNSHQKFYDELPAKPNIVIYAAGFLVENQKALHDFESAKQMMEVNYMGAVSILNIIEISIILMITRCIYLWSNFI